MENQNNQNNDYGEYEFNHAMQYGDMGGKTPEEILTQVEKLSHMFKVACLGKEHDRAEQLSNVPNLKKAIRDIKRAIGLANNDEYKSINQVEAVFTSLVEAGRSPKRLKLHHFRDDFSKLKKFFERYNLTPGAVFAEFGKSLKSATISLGVVERVLKSYIKDNFKINNWPVGKSGGKVLVELGTGNVPQAYAFDLEVTDGVQVLYTKVLTWLGLNEVPYNLQISYFQGVSFVAVDNQASWVACKDFYADFDRVYLTVTGPGL